MPAKSLPYIVLVLARNKLVLCSPTLASCLSLDFPVSIIKDLEVISPSELNAQIQAFVSNHQLKPAQIVMILTDDVCFEKSLAQVPRSQHDEIIQSFIESVPLASISSKVFRTQSADTLVVINRHLFDSLRIAFEQVGFTIAAVVPELVLGLKQSLIKDISSESTKLLLKRMDFINENSFTSSDSGVDEGIQEKEQRFLKQHQALFVVLFVVVMIACGTIAYITLTKRPAQTIRPSVPRAPKAVRLSPTPIVSVPAASESSSPAADLTGLSIQINNASGITGAASQLEKSFTALNPDQIKTGNSSVASGSTLIIFSDKLATSSRELVLETVKKTFPLVTTQEKADSTYDITIIIYKPVSVTPTPNP